MVWRRILTVAWVAEGNGRGIQGWRGRTLTWADVAAAAPGWPGGLREGLVTKLPGEGALALRSPVSRCSAPELLRP